MALIGTNNAKYAERRVLPAGQVEISERAYNLIIGGMLLWGFLVNYIIVTLFGRQATMIMAGSPGGFLIGYLICVVVGSIMISRPSATLSFIGYNLIVIPLGFVICGAVEGIPTDVIRSAVLMTAIVTLIMMIAATLFPNFFLSLGRALFASLLASVLSCLIVSLIFRGIPVIYTGIFTVIFCLYIGYDWARANTVARTVNNAIDLSASLYLDIINLFLRILRIMNRNRD